MSADLDREPTADEWRDAAVRVLQTLSVALTEQVSEMVVRQHTIDARLLEGDRRMEAIELSLRENTDITRDIRDAVVAGRVATRFIKWAGAVAIAVVCLYQAWATLIHGPGPPGGVGPGP